MLTKNLTASMISSLWKRNKNKIAFLVIFTLLMGGFKLDESWGGIPFFKSSNDAKEKKETAQTAQYAQTPQYAQERNFNQGQRGAATSLRFMNEPESGTPVPPQTSAPIRLIQREDSPLRVANVPGTVKPINPNEIKITGSPISAHASSISPSVSAAASSNIPLPVSLSEKKVSVKSSVKKTKRNPSKHLTSEPLEKNQKVLVSSSAPLPNLVLEEIDTPTSMMEDEEVKEAKNEEKKVSSNELEEDETASLTMEFPQVDSSEEVIPKENLLVLKKNRPAENAASEEDDQTQRFDSPQITLETVGAKRIMTGQESEYRITLRNQNGAAAQALKIETEIPANVEITEMSPTAGNAQLVEMPSHPDRAVCLWEFEKFDSNQEETLTLRFIPRSRNNLDFVTHYDYEKKAFTSGIQVTEPILELAIDGNEAIEWGAEERYQLKIRNSGDGEASNVRLTVSTGEDGSASSLIKRLAPGEEKTMEINLKSTVDQAIAIQMDAEADYGFTGSAQKTIEILRGHLELFVEAPQTLAMNETALYRVHVCNTGTANLQGVMVNASIPDSVEILSYPEDAEFDEESGNLAWAIDTLEPEEEIIYEMEGKMLRSGNCRIDLAAADKSGLSAAEKLLVQVEAAAAIEMKVVKPSGVIPLGKEIEYELVMVNNGTKVSGAIDSGLFLPKELTAVSIEGGGKIFAEESKVLFNKVNGLGPGQSRSFKVRAAANQKGSHKIQAVLIDREDEIQLIQEESNIFYEKRNGENAEEMTQNKTRVAMVPQSSRAAGNVQTAPKTAMNGLPNPQAL